jgi:hypothetical protein
MTQKGRWEEVQRIALTWLDHLDVDECVLIVFSSGVATFPADGSLLRVRGTDVPPARSPAGVPKVRQARSWTFTLAAMRLAYRYRSIRSSCFRRHAPTYETVSRFNAQAAEQIYALCRQHADIPIARHGLGLLRPRFSTFLRTTAQLTGGTFVGPVNCRFSEMTASSQRNILDVPDNNRARASAWLNKAAGSARWTRSSCGFLARNQFEHAIV